MKMILRTMIDYNVNDDLVLVMTFMMTLSSDVTLCAQSKCLTVTLTSKRATPPSIDCELIIHFASIGRRAIMMRTTFEMVSLRIANLRVAYIW